MDKNEVIKLSTALLRKLASNSEGQEDPEYLFTLLNAEADQDIEVLDYYLEQTSEYINKLRKLLKDESES